MVLFLLILVLFAVNALVLSIDRLINKGYVPICKSSLFDWLVGCFWILNVLCDRSKMMSLLTFWFDDQNLLECNLWFSDWLIIKQKVLSKLDKLLWICLSYNKIPSPYDWLIANEMLWLIKWFRDYQLIVIVIFVCNSARSWKQPPICIILFFKKKEKKAKNNHYFWIFWFFLLIQILCTNNLLKHRSSAVDFLLILVLFVQNQCLISMK